MPISRQAFRARDVRANILELGFEKGIELSLTLLADEIAGMRQTIKSTVENQDKIVDVLGQVTQINGAIAQQVDEMKRSEEQFDSVRGEGIDDQ